MKKASARIIPLLCVAASLAVGTALLLWQAFRPGQGAGTQGAKLAFKAVIDLGSVENGTLARVPVELTSHSVRPIRLKGFGSNCGCMQIYEMVGDGRRVVGELLLRPEETRTLFCEFRTRGETGDKTAVPLGFSEEEGNHYRITFAFTPVAHLYLVPRTLTYGEVQVGCHSKLQTQLRSDGSFTAPIGKITCSAPETFSVTFRQPPRGERETFRKKNDGQQLLGHVTMTVKAQAAGTFDQEVIVFNDGAELIRLPVTGIVAAEYELAPSRLVLPRSQSSGAVSYRGRVICCGRDHRPLDAEAVIDKSLPFEVTPVKTSSSSPRMFEVRYTGRTPIQGDSQDYHIRFRVWSAGPDRFLTLPVRILPEQQ
jgi:hypothetical protein